MFFSISFWVLYIYLPVYKHTDDYTVGFTKGSIK